MDPALSLEVALLSRQKAINDAIDLGSSQVQQFYSGATVFLTGGSGFLGKQLIEKLLRSCPDLKRIYVLLRPKKGKAAQERIYDIVKDPVFAEVRSRQPAFTDKLTAIEGDVSELRLGISEQQWRLLTDEVNVILHVAATVRFDERLERAACTNVRGTRELLALARACRTLRSVVHVSTAYAHATRSRASSTMFEKFYKTPVPPHTLIELAESVEESRLENITNGLIEDWPNTYAFTKAIAEDLVRQVAHELPICIVRPSIVIASQCEPVLGWLDKGTVYGANGIFIGAGLGVKHVIYSNKSIQIDLVPVDKVNNAIIAAAWDASSRRRADIETKIFNVTSHRNPIKWGQMEQFIDEKPRNLVSPKAIWYCYGFTTQNYTMFVILTWLFHFIPGYIGDGILAAIGKKPMLVKVYKKIWKLSTVLEYFTHNEWALTDYNLQALQSRLSDTDAVIYNFDITNLKWDEYLCTWYLGIRKYIYEDGLKDTEYGVRKQKYFRVLHYIHLLLYMFVVYGVLSITFSTIRFVTGL